MCILHIPIMVSVFLVRTQNGFKNFHCAVHLLLASAAVNTLELLCCETITTTSIFVQNKPLPNSYEEYKMQLVLILQDAFKFLNNLSYLIQN